MAIAVALWSLAVAPGEPTVINPPSDVRITNIALGDELEDASGRTTLKLTYRPPGGGEGSDSEDEDDEEEEEDKEPTVETTVLGSLTPGKIEQTTVDVVLGEDEEYLFEVVGKNTIYLTGNYIDQRPPDEEPFDEELSENGYDLRDVSSDVEVDPEDIELPSDNEGRFEEIHDDEAPPKNESKKRPRESDADDKKLSKAEKKKLNKKLKGENGEPVAAPAEKAEEKKDKKDKKEKKEKGDKPSEKSKETKTLAGGLKALDNKVGSGPQAKTGDMVSMRYIGKLENGKVFDSNTKGAPFKFRIGKGEVIKGWDVGVAGMQVGGERLLTIPAHMAYGKKGQPGIPGNSTLIFEVKLIKIN